MMLIKTVLGQFKTAWRCICLIFACALLPVVANAAETSIAASNSSIVSPLLWRVSLPGADHAASEIYILGSVHFGHNRFYPLPSYINSAFSSVKELVVEVDITRIRPEDSSELIASLGYLPEGALLSDYLSEKELASLRAICERVSVDYKQVLKAKPWFAAIQLSAVQLSRSAYEHELGVDRHFLARASDKVISELESLHGQLAMFDDISQDDQLSFLRETIAKFDGGEVYLEKISHAWMTGSERDLAKLLVDDFAKKASTRRIYQRIIVDRNVSMANAMAEYARKGKRAFFVVGVGHLVGKGGVIEKLRSEFKVDQISPAMVKKIPL